MTHSGNAITEGLTNYLTDLTFSILCYLSKREFYEQDSLFFFVRLTAECSQVLLFVAYGWFSFLIKGFPLGTSAADGREPLRASIWCSRVRVFTFLSQGISRLTLEMTACTVGFTMSFRPERGRSPNAVEKSPAEESRRQALCRVMMGQMLFTVGVSRLNAN